MHKGRAQPSDEKVKEVDEIAELINQYPVVGLMDLNKLPAACLQRAKHGLANDMKVRIAKKTVIERAIEKSDKKELLEKMINQPALILTKENPFKIYRKIDKNRSKVSAKPGDVAPEEIIVNAGPTDLPPGPAISTLSAAKIPAKVEGGKIAVIRDVVVAKKGDKITPELASILNMLKLKPIEIALNVVALWEGGMLFTKDVLAVDETKIIGDMQLSASRAFNLAMHVGWVSKETIRPLIVKAFLNAKTLGIEAGVIDSGVIGDLLAKGKRQAEALEALIPTEQKT